jgi:hypothetical protein
MTDAIDQMLDDLIANAIHYQYPTDDTGIHYKVTISYDIKVPALALPRSSSNSTPGLIRWHELIRALTLLDVAQEKLRPLQKFLIRQIIQPVIEHYDGVAIIISSPESYASAEGTSLSLEMNPGHGSGMVLDDLNLGSTCFCY